MSNAKIGLLGVSILFFTMTARALEAEELGELPRCDQAVAGQIVQQMGIVASELAEASDEDREASLLSAHQLLARNLRDLTTQHDRVPVTLGGQIEIYGKEIVRLQKKAEEGKADLETAKQTITELEGIINDLQRPRLGFYDGCVESNSLLPVRQAGKIEFKPISAVRVGNELLSLSISKQTGGLSFLQMFSPDETFSLVPDSYAGLEGTYLPLQYCWTPVLRVTNLSEKKQTIGFEVQPEGDSSAFSIFLTSNHGVFVSDPERKTGSFTSAAAVFDPAEGLGNGVSNELAIKPNRVLRKVTDVEVSYPHNFFVGPSVKQLLLLHNLIK